MNYDFIPINNTKLLTERLLFLVIQEIKTLLQQGAHFFPTLDSLVLILVVFVKSVPEARPNFDSGNKNVRIHSDDGHSQTQSERAELKTGQVLPDTVDARIVPTRPTTIARRPDT